MHPEWGEGGGGGAIVANLGSNFAKFFDNNRPTLVMAL